MIDHILGRPSTRFRKYQVLSVVLFWTLYLRNFPRHGPPFLAKLSQWLSKRYSMHQAVIVSCVALYVSRNFARVVGLESPEPLANLYDKNFFRATWVTTALDAGFWTAMHVRPKWLRRSCEILFTLYFLVCAEQADEMVRRVRGDLRVDHLQVSWNKPNTPVLKFFTRLMTPKLMKYEPRKIKIHRPRDSDYKEPVDAWLYFNGPEEDLRHQREVVLDIPGGGFVAMDPSCHDERLMAWAGKLECPVLALDYKKAPEKHYPYQLFECYDVYYQLVTTRGRCIHFSGEHVPRIIISGDSAGGNLAAATVMMILEEKSHHTSWLSGNAHNTLPPPEAVVLIYPALELNIGIWMSDEHLALMSSLTRTKENKRVLDRKADDYRRLDRNTPYHSEASSEDEDSDATPRPRTTKPKKSSQPNPPPTTPSTPTPPRLKTRLAMSSMISYTNDRIITPEMLRAMIILYIGPQRRPDFSTDYYLSPVRAPESLLARFPKTFLLCGERDPLVDDTQIFAGRLRQAKYQEWRSRKELGVIGEEEEFDEEEILKKIIVPGISHGFCQFVSVFHEGWDYIHLVRRYMQEVFLEAEGRDIPPTPTPGDSVLGNGDYFGGKKSSMTNGPSSRRASQSSVVSESESRPLELSIPSKFRMTKISTPSASSSSSSSSKHHRRTPSGSGLGRYSTRAGVGDVAAGRRRREYMSGRMSPAETRNVVNRLASSEDLLERRMKSMTAPMFGGREGRDT